MCRLCLADRAVDVTFLSDYQDRSGNNHPVVHTGGSDSEIGPNGTSARPSPARTRLPIQTERSFVSRRAL
eukprot:COSAG03_NODE_705_length_6186_cov_3.663217_3_plen_70_part_00